MPAQPTRLVKCTADTSRTSSTTLQDVTGISLSLKAGVTYSFELQVAATYNSSGGLRLAFGGTATMTSIRGGGNNTSLSNFTLAQFTTMTAVFLNSASIGSASDTFIKGSFVVNTAGTITLQMAQSASNGAATTVSADGTWLRVTEAA